LPEEDVLCSAEAPQIRIELGRPLELQGCGSPLPSTGPNTVDVLQEGFDPIRDLDAPCRDVSVDLALAFLPLGFPEPCLVSRNSNLRTQFDNTVFALNNLDLGARLIQMMTPANVDGQDDLPALAYPHEPVGFHAFSIAE
jgi:hypothetical protein